MSAEGFKPVRTCQSEMANGVVLSGHAKSEDAVCDPEGGKTEVREGDSDSDNGIDRLSTYVHMHAYDMVYACVHVRRMCVCVYAYM